MELQEKIIVLRKQKGWSQEELSYQLDVSRQAVSKWESGASIPDIDKIIQMSKLFNVSTDYLLKNEEGSAEPTDSIKVVSKEEAINYLVMVKGSIGKIGFGVMLCILSPITLILLAGLSEEPYLFLSEQMAAGIGMGALLLLIAIAVVIFIIYGTKYSKYEYLNKEKIYTNYDTTQMIKKEKDEFEGTYVKAIAIGTVLCIFSIVPLIVLSCLEINDFYSIVGCTILLAVVSIAVLIFTIFGGIHMSYSKLLQEGDYSIENKEKKEVANIFTPIYWCTITAIYLLTSFLTKEWRYTWIIWPVAGVFYAGIVSALNYKYKNK